MDIIGIEYMLYPLQFDFIKFVYSEIASQMENLKKSITIIVLINLNIIIIANSVITTLISITVKTFLTEISRKGVKS